MSQVNRIALRTVSVCAVVVVIVVGVPHVAQAAPAWGEVFPMSQPDGSMLEVRIWGDEFYQTVESLDGYTLVRDPDTLFICYAKLTKDGRDFVSTGIPFGQDGLAGLNIEKHLRIPADAVRAKGDAVRAEFIKAGADWLLPQDKSSSSRATTIGDVQGICLIIDFPDEPGTITSTEIDAYCNQIGYSGYGNNGSVRDYFQSVSGNLLDYTNFVPAAYYTTIHNKSYYTDPSIPYGTRAREMITEALNDLEAGGFDFSAYDSDGDNVIDALNCFYAGYSDSAWAEGLWPHAWTISFCADGVCTNSYQITDIQNSLRLSTFCHENGHMLCGWPDLYDYDYDSNGVGRFCLMCYGTSDTNPCEPCAYMKYRAGWADLQIIDSPFSGYSVPAATNVIYKYNHPSQGNEYYLIENRQKTGRDSGIPDAGLAIWHIDTYGSNNNQQMTPSLHYLVTLVQADGDWDLEHNYNYGDSTDLWASPSYTTCSPTTSPNTQWWSGGFSGLVIDNISASGATMTFDFDNVDCNDNGVDDADDMVTPPGDDCNSNGVLDECDIAWGTSEDVNGNGIPDECEGDVVPPQPNPMFIIDDPAFSYASGPTEITLRAETATDDTPPIEYAFYCVAGYGHDRGWDTSEDYVDTGLDVNHAYTYRVQARDSNTYPNTTSFEDAPTINIATAARQPGEPLLDPGSPPESVITLEFDAIDNPSWTEFAIQCTDSSDAAWDNYFVDAAGLPSVTEIWQRHSNWGTVQIVGLQPGTAYTFAVKAQNLDDIETALGTPATITTAGSACASDMGDLNSDDSTTGEDIQCFLDCLLDVENDCAYACGDWDEPPGVGMEDIESFVNTLLDLG